jgi:histidyl-tRNA synthetase
MAMAKITAPRGTKDILPSESYKWQYIENVLRTEAAAFGYKEIRFPTFEHTELFLRGVGETTDVVQKEMYTFRDKGGVCRAQLYRKLDILERITGEGVLYST